MRTEVSMRPMRALSVLLFSIWTVAASAVFGAESERLVIGALGDSITTAVNSTDWGARTIHSWSTGSGTDGIVESHFKRLKSQFPEKQVSFHNVARGGAKSSGLASQLSELSVFAPDYVTLLIGANDACSWNAEESQGQLDRFEQNVRQSVSGLVEQNSGIRIAMLPIPDMHALWEKGMEMNCQWLWNLTGVCPSLLGARVTHEERLAFQLRVNEANQRLDLIADEFPDQVKFNQSLGSYRFSTEHISPRDCFHPSGAGQDLIARLAWENGWYSD